MSEPTALPITAAEILPGRYLGRMDRLGIRMRTHYMATDTINVGRLHRKAGQLLCRPSAVLDEHHTTDGVSEEVDCPKCLEIVERLRRRK